MRNTRDSRRDFIKNILAATSSIAVAGSAHSSNYNSPPAGTNTTMKLSPPRLKKGDTIGFYSPSTPATSFATKRFERAKAFLQTEGFTLKAGTLTGNADFYRSGSIEERAEELNQLIRDPNVTCIMSTMGGMVSNSLLPYIDYEAIKKQPKIFVGYSDVSAILLGIYAQTGLSTFYGPALVSSLGEMGYFLTKTYDYFRDVVQTRQLPYVIENPEFWTEEYIDWQTQTDEKPRRKNRLVTINSGNATGRLMVTNLNTLSGLFGTPYMPDINRGDILVLEDSFKDAAHTERSCSHLKLAGVFDRIAGLAIGKHEKFDDQGTGRTSYQVMMEVIGKVNYPVLAEYDCAHTHPMITLPIGGVAALNADTQQLTLLAI